MRRPRCGPSIWHVLDRGARRLLLFQDDSDFETFLNCLQFGLVKSGCELWGFALMSNHYHLVLYGDSDQVTECMYHVNKLYAHLHNAKYRQGGHVFDGPYRAFRVRTFRLAMWTLAYVFLNPVKAGLCSRPEDYRWSGYRSFVGLPGSPLEVHAASFMSKVDLPLGEAWERFHLVTRLLRDRPHRQVPGRPTMAEVHLNLFDWLLQQAREHPSFLAGEDPVQVAVWWGRLSGIAPRVMATHLGLRDSKPVRQMLFRFGRRMAQEASLARLSDIP